MEATHLHATGASDSPPPRPPLTDAERRFHLNAFVERTVAALYRSRWFLASLVGFVGVASVIITLLMPNVYEANARALVPDASSSMLSSLLGGSTANVARRFLGSGTNVGTYTRPLAILTSRTVNEAVVDSFDLVHVYKLQDTKAPREEALRELATNTSFGVDEEFEFLSISVRDKDPRRAAAMTNLFVRLLNRTHSALSTENARTYRVFIQERYDAANHAIDSLLDATTAFQRRYGVVDLPAQTQAYFTQMGVMRAEQARLQVQLQMLRTQLGPEANEVKAAEQALAEATRQYQAALNGSEAALPISRGSVPTVAREFAELERERVMQKSALEVLAPMYEAARMEEGRQVEVVQVLDYATPPHRKVAPKRMTIVLAAALSAFLVGLVFVVLRSLWIEHRADWIAWTRRADGRAA